MAATGGTLYITYVEKQGAFLKIWGQTDRNLPVIIEKSLAQTTPQFDHGHFMPSLENIQCGLLCCAKYKDGAYYRARITNVNTLHQHHKVEVQFVDYGNRDAIPVMNLRTMGNFAPGLITIPPQARDFILANVTHHGSAWDNDTISLISSEIRYMELPWVAVSQIGTHTLIKLYSNGDDVALSFFNRGMVLSIASTAQHLILQNTGAIVTPPLLSYQVGASMSPSALVAPAPPSPAMQPAVAPPPALLTYKSITLEPGVDNNVYVSYVTDGPCHFSVQMKKLEDTLARLMKELNRMPLQPLEDDPIPGTVCVARCLEDEHICRAVVTSMVDGQYKVFYVDFGNTEVVSLDSLYQIPFKYVIPKIMAMRYALAGLDRSSVTLEMKCAFKEFVNDKMLRMRALPPPTRSALPICSLWDENNVNVLDVLRQAALLAYPEVIQLARGFSQEVRVSYVHSCSHFYVQVKLKEEELRKVMAELQANCPRASTILPSDIKIGLPCCALFDADGQWYRAEVLLKEGDNVKVRYVDYGNQELVAINNLRMPFGEFLTALRPQALECCLNGYQNMADDLERDNTLEELILEKEFVMKVVEMQGNRALVDLNDSSRYNVGSLLLERLASARSQVSPLLIQDGHHIEQRKRRSPVGKGFPQKVERKPMRDQNDTNWNNEKGWNNNEKGWNNRDKGWNKDDKGGNRDDKGWNNNDKGWNKDDKGGNRDDKGWNNNDKGWNNDDKGKYNRQDSWRQPRPPRKDDGGDDERNGGDIFDRSKGRRDGFKRDSWGGGASSDWKRNGKSPSQKEGSEKSWSDGSEKNWRRSPRTNNQSDDKRPPRRKFDGGNKGSSSWNSSNHDSGRAPNDNLVVAKVMDPAPSTADFIYPDLNGRSENVLISWFHDPGHFFCQLHEYQVQFRTMMNEIQNQYCNIKPDRVNVGAPAIALYPDDGVMYRAKVLEVKGMQYRVQYIDFGNVAMTDKVWPIENKFMQIVAQAICCGLNSVVPSGDAWPNPDVFSTYFDKESFTCTFISSENQNYSVELTCDDHSVSEALISAGLAKYNEFIMAQENFDPSLLLGQQIQIMLGEVQNLDMFYVIFQNGLQLLCAMHNLALATQTFEDVLKQYVGSNLIMYVDNVLEEKMEITLYDTSGTKLKIVEPDEGAYETLDLPCQLPIFSSTINGWISYFTPTDGDKHRVFIQPPEYSVTLAQLLEDLFNSYDASGIANPLQPEVGLFYAVHSSDGNWYRGQVANVEGETVTVTFVDYGNSESVALPKLRELAPEFMQQHLLAVEVQASGVDETFMEQEVTANVWYAENGWEAIIHKLDQSVVQTKPEALLEDHSPVIAEEKLSEKLPEQLIEEKSVTNIPEPQTDQLNQMGVSVILSHVDSPSEFYLQLSEDLDTINNLQATLQEQVLSFPDLENPAAGVLCAAPYSLDQQWYRAQVLDADVDITTVRFVDYGNTDVLTNTTTHVKTLPADLLSLEQHARRCSLIVKATDGEWSPAACERFEALTGTDNLSAEIVHQDEKTTFIELYAEGQNVAEILLQEGLSVKLQLETESSCSGYVSHLNSPSEFWVQLENSVADLEWIAEQLSVAENFPELEDLTPGSLCAALFPDDEMWYRARILSNTVAGLEVLFIDYGNSCTCTGLRQLPEDLIMLPALAQKCSLQKPPGVLQWSTYATEEFKNISADGATIFNIDKLSTGETTVVRLLLDGEDISTKLLAKTEDAYVSYFESISSFWLQKAANSTKLNAITEKLVEAVKWPKYEPSDDCDIVAALCTEKDQWYRTRILNKKDSEYEVLFIDYGNTSTTSDIRKLISDIEKESPLANKYKLESLPGFRWNEESSKQLAKISDNGTTLFQVEFVTGDAVRLYINGSDIRSDLDSTSVSSAYNTPKKNTPMKTEFETVHFTDNDSELLTVSTVKTEEGVLAEVPEEAALTEMVTENEAGMKLLLTEIINQSQEAATEGVTANTNEKLPSKEITKLENLEAYNSVKETTKKEESIEKVVMQEELINMTADIERKNNEETLEDTLVKPESFKKLDEDDIKSNEECNTQEVETETDEITELKAEVTSESAISKASDDIKKEDEHSISLVANITPITSSVIKDKENSQNILQQGATEECTESESCHDTSHRRASVPYSEKIVPGSIARGDLNEVLSDDELSVNSKKEGDDNQQHVDVDIVTPSSLSEEHKHPKQIASYTSPCKMNADDRIVPGAISRGDTPEPPHDEGVSDKTILGAVNGDATS